MIQSGNRSVLVNKYVEGWACFGLQCLPFMASSQIICCCSRVAEKIQETLPHRKEVNRMNHGINQAEILICSYIQVCRKRESWNSISNTSIYSFVQLAHHIHQHFITHISRPSTLSFTFTMLLQCTLYTLSINIIIVETFFLHKFEAV